MVSGGWNSRGGINITSTPHNVRLYIHCVSCLLQGSIIGIVIRVGDVLGEVRITTGQEIQILFYHSLDVPLNTVLYMYKVVPFHVMISIVGVEVELHSFCHCTDLY